ncbi:MAG: hypothetical protein AB7L76_12925 [Burkholderiaceae bacterium]
MNDIRNPLSVKRLFALFATVCLSLLLAACGGGGAKGEGGGNTTPIDPYPPGSGLSPYVTLQILNGAAVSNTLPIGAVRTVKAAVINSAGAPVPNVVVTFTAPADLARLNPAIGTALTDASGVATLTIEGLAVGAGTLTAAVIVEAFERKVNLNFSVVPDTSPQAGTITFKQASVQTLKLGGTIGESTSVLTFQVVNQLGQPRQGATVNFAPTVTTGGLSVAPLTAVSDANGMVSTVVSAGTVPTPVRVTASMNVDGNVYSAQSIQLSVSSGDPTQKFFSLSVETFNIHGCNFDGTTTKINARAGDQFGNPVPDGTTVNFITEGGRVGASSIGSCQTENGVCSVDLESQEFRPFGYTGAQRHNNCRVTVLAYAVGKETFSDANANGVYDAGEAFEDLPDVFLNTELSDRSTFNLARGDRLVKFIEHGQTSPVADGVWGDAHVRRSAEVVFSSINVETPILPSELVFECRATSATEYRLVTEVRRVDFELHDINNNPLAAGSTLSASATNATIDTLSPSTVPNTTRIGGSQHSLFIKGDPSKCSATGGSGQVRLSVTPVGGAERIYAFGIRYTADTFSPGPITP